MHALFQLMRRVGISLKGLDIYNRPSHPAQDSENKHGEIQDTLAARMAYFPG